MIPTEKENIAGRMKAKKIFSLFPDCLVGERARARALLLRRMQRPRVENDANESAVSTSRGQARQTRNATLSECESRLHVISELRDAKITIGYVPKLTFRATNGMKFISGLLRDDENQPRKDGGGGPFISVKCASCREIKKTRNTF